MSLWQSLMGALKLGIPIDIALNNRSLCLWFYPKPPTQPEEKAAFDCGMASINWAPYWRSFKDYNCWRHPIAFSAGIAQGKKLMGLL